MIGVGIVGYGYWGPNLVRNFSEAVETRVIAVCDLRTDSLALVGRRYPAIRTTPDFSELLVDPAIDAIAVATPVRSHFELALAALQAGKHVLLEKPMTETAEQARRLIEVAEPRNLVLMVDHTFVYTPAVRKIRDLVAADELGKIYYYDSIRVNLGLFQHDVNVIWDLAVHDFSILEYVLAEHPVAVSANGVCAVPQSLESIAYISLFFASGTIAHINVNWLAPVKIRQILMGGNRKMIVYNELEPSEKVRVYDKGVTLTDDPNRIYQLRVGYRDGDMWAPQLSNREGLAVAVEHFVDCMTNGRIPETDGRVGMRVVELLEAASRSLDQGGRPVELKGLSW
jgi:predicted dehydrogenase